MEQRINQLNEFLKEDYTRWGSREYLEEFGTGKKVTFAEFIEDVNYLAQWFISNGYKGKNIGIFSPNSIAWMITDIAVMNYVGMCVGLSKDWVGENLIYAIEKCDIECLLYGAANAEVVDGVKDRFPGIRFICIEEEFDKMLEEGKRDLPELFALPEQSSDAPAKVVFTSGTTSFPKAVMLSITNCFFSWKSLQRRITLGTDDICYLFLPLNHTYGSIFNFMYSLVFGYKIVLADKIPEMAQEMMAVRPTAFSAVPLVCKKFQDGAAAMNLPIQALLGGRLKYLFCGGATLPLEMRNAYAKEGIYLMNAYALSETASGFAIDYPNETDPDSAGTVLEDVEVKVVDPEEDGYGELAIRGDNIFLGYYKDEEATRKVMAPDGFFLTGDIGKIVDNKVYLRGRKDTMITLSNGENISSSKIASKVKAISPDIVQVKAYVRDGILTCDIYAPADSSADFDKLIADLNNTLPKFERIKAFTVMDSAGLIK
ncbi:MAG: AMP-binding protein [Clostridiales bacterium]|nr:AMP-binding protein [Clostridiales bacterium]